MDIIYLSSEAQKPDWIVEIKWSDRVGRNQGEETKHLCSLIKKHKSIEQVVFTTRTIEGEIDLDGITTWVYPTAAYCYVLGRNIMVSEGHIPSPTQTKSGDASIT